MNNKIIFCDIHGVLIIGKSKSHDIFDPKCVENLNNILNITNAKIVISSTWRYLYSLSELQKIFYNQGIIQNGVIIDVTPSLEKKINDCWVIPSRGLEIQKWLNKWNTKNFCIIDDNNDMEHLEPYLVQTEFDFGIEEKHMKRVIGILGEKNGNA